MGRKRSLDELFIRTSDLLAPRPNADGPLSASACHSATIGR